MGTPAFAVPSLKALLENGYEVPAVLTAPDRPAGRGQKIQYSAVKDFVLGYNVQGLNGQIPEKQIQLLQPEKLKNPEFVDFLSGFKVDLQIVVAFRMLPKLIWAMPPLGTFNLHASLLPQYRGAAPINWAIINGEKISGITTFFLNEEIDAGKLILQKELAIGDEETAGEYHDRLMEAGASLVVQTVKALESGLINTQEEQESSPLQVKIAPKLDKLTGLIHWENTTDSIYNLIRGLSPFPTAFTYLNGLMLKIFKANKMLLSHSEVPGSVETDGKTFIRYYSKDGYLDLVDIQLENKKRMQTQDLLRGYRMPAGIQSK